MSELKQTSVALLEKAIDDKIRKAVKGGQSTHLATVTRVGNDGTTWVQIYGGADETPVRRMTTAAQVGDVINVTFSGLSCMGVGNVSSPAATSLQVAKVATENADAIRGVMNGLLQVRQLVADKVTTRELLALDATVMNLAAQLATVEEVLAGTVTAEYVNANYAAIDFANVMELETAQAVVQDLIATSGIFERTVTEDASVVGMLKAVEIDGDLIKADTIVADRIVFQGVDGDGNQTGLWYALNASGAGAEALDLDDARYRDALDGSNIVAKSVTANEIDTASLVAFEAFVEQMRAATLEADHLQVGKSGDGGGAHIVVDGDRMSFRSANGDEVAYIAIDGNESTFNMTKAVVVKDLRFGRWKWQEGVDGGLSLKWMGGGTA